MQKQMHRYTSFLQKILKSSIAPERGDFGQFFSLKVRGNMAIIYFTLYLLINSCVLLVISSFEIVLLVSISDRFIFLLPVLGTAQ